MPDKPIIKSVVLNSVNITNAIVPDILSLTYTDLLEAGASTFDLEIRNKGRSLATPPTMGDYLEIKFGYQGSVSEVNTGTCRVDDVIREYGHDTLRIGARAYDYGIGLKSNVGSSGKIIFQNSTLRSIVQTIASQFSLTLVGTSSISTEVVGTTATLGSSNIVTESGDTWLDLAQKLAVKYGYAFNLKLGQMLFRSYDSLNAQGYSVLLTSTDLVPRPRFRENIVGNYQKATVASKTGTTVTLTDNTIPGVRDTVDLTSEGYYNSINNAVLRATGAIIESNKDRHIGQVKIPGNPNAIAGNNAYITTLDDRDEGMYGIDRAVHTLSASEGWTVQLDLRKIFAQNITTV